MPRLTAFDTNKKYTLGELLLLQKSALKKKDTVQLEQIMERKIDWKYAKKTGNPLEFRI